MRKVWKINTDVLYVEEKKSEYILQAEHFIKRCLL